MTKRVDGWQVETDRSTHAGRVVILTSPAYVSADLVREVDGELVAAVQRGSVRVERVPIALAFPRAPRLPIR